VVEYSGKKPMTKISFFNRYLPASFEVTFIPLLLAYLWIFITLPVSLWIASLGPAAFLVMAFFFIICDIFDRTPVPLVLAKVAVSIGLIAPILLLLMHQASQSS
jgi:hypothetical protein